MRYHALACDYDGTIATHGVVDAETIAALERIRSTGRKLLLVTGRELDDLLKVFPQPQLFDRIVAENGALLYRPGAKEELLLTEPASEKLYGLLKERGVAPLSRGRAIISTWEPHETEALAAIRDLSLEAQVIFNKGAVMLLPAGVNKASGLRAALEELNLSPHNTVGVGDAENDHAFLSLCECSVSVANALPSIKERTDFATRGARGSGVAELIDRLMKTDLSELEPLLTRHHILLGNNGKGAVTLSPFGRVVLITGTSGGGKSTVATGILERLAEKGYQFCIVDPEGDYTSSIATVIGDADRVPKPSEVVGLLNGSHNATVNLLGIEIQERPAFLRSLFSQLQELRTQTGRPHWLLLDEAHHLLPTGAEPELTPIPSGQSILMLTVHPESVAKNVLASVDTVLAIGDSPEKRLQAVAEALGEEVPQFAETTLRQGESLYWLRDGNHQPVIIETVPPAAERRRHRRKYAEGELGEDRSFYFRGADQKLNLRAYNLTLFVQMAEGVGDDVWLHHLKKGDYSNWFRTSIKDDDLASDAAEVERNENLSAAESRAAIADAIKKRYTAPALVPETK
jgi:HAD superfamily hydrolase (TIGR01484 family)